MACLMRQPRRGGDVANRPKAGHVGAAVGIGFEETAIHLYAKRFQPDILGIGNNANGDDAMCELRSRDFSVLALNRCRYASSSRLQAFDTRPGHDGHALFCERLFKEG